MYYETLFDREQQYAERAERQEIEREQLAAGTHYYDKNTGTVREKAPGCCQQCDDNDAKAPVIKGEYRVQSKAKHDPVWSIAGDVDSLEEARKLKESAESIRRETNPRVARILKRETIDGVWMEVA